MGAFLSVCERKAPRTSAQRPIAATGVLALVVAVALVFGPAGGAAAESGECEWRPHKVRVVKHVKRHGKRVRVVRKRVRWSCVPVPSTPPSSSSTPTTPAAAAAPLQNDVPAPTPPEEELGNPHWLGAQAYEFRFEPTKERFEVVAGLDTIELINRGQDAHDLHLESLETHETVLEIAPVARGGHARGIANLEPGQYRLYCSLSNHAAEGMEETLIVTP